MKMYRRLLARKYEVADLVCSASSKALNLEGGGGKASPATTISEMVRSGYSSVHYVIGEAVKIR